MQTSPERVVVACPQCRATVSIRRTTYDAGLGRQARCLRCRAEFRLTTRQKIAASLTPETAPHAIYAALVGLLPKVTGCSTTRPASCPAG